MKILAYLQEIPNFPEYSRKSKILLLAYYLRQNQGLPEFRAADLQACCRGVMKPPSQLPQQLALLSKGKRSPLIPGGKKGYYSLSIQGITEVETYLSAGNRNKLGVDAILENAIPYLKKFVARVGEENQRKFIAEAVSCLKVDARRATIIMTWAATLDHLYEYVLAHRLADFNTALHIRKDPVSRLTVIAKDDFAEMKETVFIEVSRSARVISNDVRKILDEKLGVRNTCAHASGVEVHPSKVVNFVEDLVDNVILKYKV